MKLPSIDNVNPEDQQQLLSESINATATLNPATTSTLRGQVGTVQTIQLRPSPTAGSPVGATNNGIVTKTPGNATMRSNLRGGSEVNPTKGPNVMPLLTSYEICRQLQELRRHNDELRRRVEVVQKEKEDMLHRIERLEQLLMVRESDAEMDYVDI